MQVTICLRADETRVSSSLLGASIYETAKTSDINALVSFGTNHELRSTNRNRRDKTLRVMRKGKGCLGFSCVKYRETDLQSRNPNLEARYSMNPVRTGSR